MILETKLDTECVLARKSIWITEPLWISTGVIGDRKHILSLEVYAGVLQMQCIAQFLRDGITQ